MKTLIALATAGVLASVGSRCTADARIDRHSNPAVMIPVQYYDNWDDRSATIDERESRITGLLAGVILQDLIALKPTPQENLGV